MKLKQLPAGVVLVALSVLCGCNKTPVDSSGPDGYETVLAVNTTGGELSKTWMDNSATGSTVPVYWSDGDAIAVNGTPSSPLSVPEGTKLKQADFKVKNTSAPFRVLYPASDVKSFDNKTGFYTIDIPSSQKYEAGSFACGSAILYGTAQTDSNPIQLKNLCGAIKVTLKDNSAAGETPSVVKSIILTSLGEQQKIAGVFTLNPADGSLNVVDGTSTLTVEMPENGVTLSKEGTPFIITIPQGYYPKGFSLKIIDQNIHTQRNFWLRMSSEAKDSVSVLPGKIVNFQLCEFNPVARKIESVSDWEEFAAAYNSGVGASEWISKDGIITVAADIQAVSLTAVKELKHTLNAGGHTITRTAAKGPLFEVVKGKVDNMILAGTLKVSSSTTFGVVPMASALTSGGQIENCTNKMTISSELSSETYAAAFVKTLSGGTLKNCVNEGKLDVKVNINNGNVTAVAGGLVATVDSDSKSLKSQCMIENCTNKAAVEIVLIKQAAKATAPVFSGFGGLVGTVLKGDADAFLKMTDCVNEADVTVSYSEKTSAATNAMSSVGGLVGALVKFDTTITYQGRAPENYNPNAKKDSDINRPDYVYAEIRNCINRGTISSSLASQCSSEHPTKSFVGGLFGVINGKYQKNIKVTACKNYGIVKTEGTEFSRSALCLVTGGLAGMGAYVDFSECVVNSKQIGSLTGKQYSSSAGLGYVMATFSFNKCKFFADVYQFVFFVNVDEEGRLSENYSQGFTLSSLSHEDPNDGGQDSKYVKSYKSSVKQCGFGGTFHYNSAPVKFNNAAFTLDKQETITASSVPDKESGVIASKSFYNNGNNKGWCTNQNFMNISDDNTYWDGVE